MLSLPSIGARVQIRLLINWGRTGLLELCRKAYLLCAASSSAAWQQLTDVETAAADEAPAKAERATKGESAAKRAASDERDGDHDGGGDRAATDVSLA